MYLITGIAESLLQKLRNVPSWMEKGACTDTDLYPFWPDDQEDFKKVCDSCPVMDECRDYFDDLHDNARSIDRGVFHGKDYGEEE